MFNNFNMIKGNCCNSNLMSSQPQGTLLDFISSLSKFKKQFSAFSAANDITHRLQGIEWIASNVIYYIQETQWAPKVTWTHPHCSSIWSITPNFSSKLEWFSYDLEMETHEQNRNNKRTKELIQRIQTRLAFGWLSKRSGENNSVMSEKFLEIKRYFALTSYCKTIAQSNNTLYLFHITVFFGRKTKRPCFDLFIHGSIKQITNTYRIIFQGHTKIALKSFFSEQ